MAMKNPPHVGETIWHDIIKPLDLSVTEGAKALGVTRQSLSLLVNGRTSLTPDMALRGAIDQAAARQAPARTRAGVTNVARHER